MNKQLVKKSNQWKRYLLLGVIAAMASMSGELWGMSDKIQIMFMVLACACLILGDRHAPEVSS